MKTTIKKTIAILMISLGFIIMLTDSDGGLIATLIIKMANCFLPRRAVMRHLETVWQLLE